MSMVFDFAFLLLVVTFSFGPLMVSSSLNLHPRFAHQTLIRSLLVFILKDSKHSRLQAFGRTLCHRPRNFLSHSRGVTILVPAFWGASGLVALFADWSRPLTSRLDLSQIWGARWELSR
jgi:hypothetical protein